jgi:hypothetical protein
MIEFGFSIDTISREIDSPALVPTTIVMAKRRWTKPLRGGSEACSIDALSVIFLLLSH